jgi:Zn-finger nucleic acid-binding protein
VVLEVESIEIDHCLACGGVWLDRGELELLLEGASNRDELMGALRACTEKKRKRLRCPICSRRLQKVRYGIDREIVLDKCPRDDGIWFERDELTRALEMGRYAGRPVYDVLYSIFGGASRDAEK